MNTKAEEAYPTVIVQEGKVKFIIPDPKMYVNSRSDYAPSKAPVFYNPVMEFSRDLSVIALQTYQHMSEQELTICEPLTATGVRGIRYASEVRGIHKIVIGDISTKAVEIAEKNVALNNLADKISVEHSHANKLLSNYSFPRSRFSVIDLDPFGTPVPYLESALQSLQSGGLLAATATDLASLCGVHPKACRRKYGGNPLRTEYAHELAVRLLAGAIARTAAKHDMGTQPVFSYYTDHYVRVNAIVKYGAKQADQTLTEMGYVFHCFKCFHRETVPEYKLASNSMVCRECGSKLSLAGPLWIGKIIDKAFAEDMLHEAQKRLLRQNLRIETTLSLALAEADKTPGYYDVDAICDSLNLPVPPPSNVTSLLTSMGLDATPTLFCSSGLRSNATANQVRSAVLAALEDRTEGK